MLKKGLTVQKIATDLGLSRNTVSLAINHSLFEPSRQRIAEHLNIEP